MRLIQHVLPEEKHGDEKEDKENDIQCAAEIFSEREVVWKRS
jgi:hypothetical protein